MRDFFTSSPVQQAAKAPAFAGWTMRATPWLPGRPTLTVVSLAAALLLVADAATLGADTPFASGIGYLSITLVFAMCAWAFRAQASYTQGTLFLRWSLMAGGALLASIGFFLPAAESFFHIQLQRQIQIICFSASEVMYMLAAVLFFAQVARSIVILDVLQSLMFTGLRDAVTYVPARNIGYAVGRLWIAQSVALFLFSIAMVGCLGAASRGERKFLRTLCWFFGLRFAAIFLSNQVGAVWLHHLYCSEWDAVGVALICGFALYELFTSRSASSPAMDEPLGPSSLLVRSLMPSFLALGNLLLGLLALRVSEALGVGAILVAVGCYVVRTVLLQAQVMQEKALLESRNEHLEDLAIRDHLTGIGNRRSLARIYGRMHAAPVAKRVSLLLMDIDFFKQANDTHGNLHGDRVLIALAAQLKGLADGVTGSHCARLGGDEFVLLIPDVTPRLAESLAESLRLKFFDYTKGDEGSRLSLSVGLASLESARDLPLETLVSIADEALYRAKVKGRNRVEAQPVWDGRSPLADAVSAVRSEMAHSSR